MVVEKEEKKKMGGRMIRRRIVIGLGGVGMDRIRLVY